MSFDNLKEQILQKLADALGEAKRVQQMKPNQYVVAYYKKDDDTLIGYHLDTFCQRTEDILEAKRYNGDNPYSQLEIIAKNLAYTINEGAKNLKDSANLVNTLNNSVYTRFWKDYKEGDIYLDAVYLADGTEPQKTNYKILLNDHNSGGLGESVSNR